MYALFYGCALRNLDNAAAQQLCKTTNPMEKSLFIPVVNKCILSTYTLHELRHILVHIVHFYKHAITFGTKIQSLLVSGALK